MSPDTSKLVVAVNRALQDPNVRTSIRNWHKAKFPLVEMVETLGLEEDMTEAIRKLVESLSPAVVESIREATLDMLNRVDAGVDPTYAMPLQCEITAQQLDSGAAVDVTVQDKDGLPTIFTQLANAS
jgi:hypothetical protein